MFHIITNKILSISNEAPRFVSRFDAFVAGAEGKVINGGEPGFLQFKFEGPDSNSNESFGFIKNEYNAAKKISQNTIIYNKCLGAII